jgi:hypothetical protein
MRTLLPLVLVLVVVSSRSALAAAPEPPRNLSAVVAGATVTLNWQASPTGGRPVGYIVEAALSPGGPTVAGFLVIETSIVLQAVSAGVYYVRIRAGNGEGISAPSTETVVSVGVPPCTSAPNPPIGLSSTVVSGLVTLSWLGPEGGCPAAAYMVQAGSSPGASDLAVFTVGTATTVAVSAAVGTYFVRVVACNGFGCGGASNELTVIVASTAVDITGVWSGTSDYINAPFRFNFVQRGDSVSGTYQDQHDFGGVAGVITGSHIVLDVNFGDTGIRFEGTIVDANRIRGTIRVPVLGRTFTFEMTR